MGIFERSNGAWIEGTLRVRNGGGWTDDNDNRWIRKDGAWLQFGPSSSSSLLAPASFAGVASGHTVDLSWTNPTQALTPTNVQIRLPEVSTVWTEVNYGVLTQTFSALDPARPYQAQVRYIIRSATDGTVSNTGPSSTIFFTSASLYGPGVPADSPTGTTSNSTTPWGPTYGTGGAVGGSDCSWEYVVQIPGAPIEFELLWDDTAVTGTAAGTITELDLDFVALGLTCGELARYKFREVCNLVPGEWQYSQAWIIACDWTDPCGGLPESPAWTRGAFATAVLQVPQPCMNDSDFILRDQISSEEYGKLPGYVGMGVSDLLDWHVKGETSNTQAGTAMIAGHSSAINAWTSATDFSFTLFVDLKTQPPAAILGGTRLLKVGDRVSINAYASGAGYTVSAVFPKTGGGVFNLIGTTVIALDTKVAVSVTCDQDGNKILYLDDVAEVTDADTNAADIDTITGAVEFYGNAKAEIGPLGAWNSVLTSDQIRSLFLTVTPYEALALSHTPAVYWSMNSILVETTTSYDAQAAGLPGISVYFPMDSRVT
tara:strand:- start:1536 stop:3164 length:1629 start_codon:yes stop_codon:yes gene_type:complete